MSTYKSYVPWSKRERESSYSSTKSDSSAQQNDATTYKPRTSSALGTNGFGRGTPTGSQLPSYKSAYSAASPANTSRASSKDRTLSSYGSSYAKRDREKPEERPSYKYAAGLNPKESDKNRLHAERAVTEDLRAKSPLSGSTSSLLEKYSNLREPSVKASDRPTSVLDKYTRGASREKSREPDVVPRFVSSTYPGTTASRGYASDRPEKKERSEHPPVSYRGLRVPAGSRSSREPSPEIGTNKSNCYRAYSRAPSFGRTTSGSLPTPESGSTLVAPSRYTAAGTRFGLTSRGNSEHVPTAISYSGSDRFRTPSSKRSMTPLRNDVAPRSTITRVDVASRVDNCPKKIDAETKAQEESEQDDEDEEDQDDDDDDEDEDDDDDQFVTLTVITRGTSPSAPSSSAYVRTRRAETARMIQKEITRPKRRPEMKDEGMQSDRMDDTARFSRYGGGRAAVTPWTSYLEKYSPNSSSSSGYVSRGYSTGSGASSVSSRIGGFGFSRPTESATPSRCDSVASRTASPGVGQECNGSISKLPNDSTAKVQSSELHRPSSITKATCCNEPSHSSSATNASRSGFSAPSREESPAKTDGSTSGPGSQSDPKSESTYEGERPEGIRRTSSVPKIEETNQRISLGPKLEGLVGSRSESKLAKSTSKNECPAGKNENVNQRRSSAPKFEGAPLKYDESASVSRRRESTPAKKDNSQSRRDSLSKSDSGSSQSKISLSRNSSGKNISSRQISRTDSSDSAVNLPNGRSKSSSVSSIASLSGKIRTTPPPVAGKCTTTNLRQANPVDGGARGKPPVPKTDASSTGKISTSGKYVNKDFRKSALNMETGEISRSKLERKRLKKQRSMSISSQDSQSEPNSESIHQVASCGSSTSVKSNQSGSKLKLPSTLSKGLIQRVGTPPRRSSPVPSNSEAKNSGSFSKSPSRRRKTMSRSATSSSASSTSSSSSSTDDEEDVDQRSSSRRRRRRASGSTGDKRCRSSAGSSRTSILASSADESSMATDRPPLPPASPKSRSESTGKTEEAKSFLMRALAPVTNLFKVKHQDSGELRAGWLDSTPEISDTGRKNGSNGMSLSKSITQSLSKSLSFTNSEKNDKKKKQYQLTHQVSGERAWWLEANPESVPEGVEKLSVHSDDLSQDTTISNVLSDDGKFKFKIWRQDSGDTAWWLETNENVPEDGRKESTPKSPLSRRGSSRGSAKSERRNRIKHQQSGERAWWMSEDPESVPEGVEVIPAPAREPTPHNVDTVEGFYPDSGFPKTIGKIRHVDSGEKAWWMDSSSNVPEGIENIHPDTSISNSDSSESLEKVEIGVAPGPEVQLRRSLSRFPIEFPPPPPDEPLGDRASPEGVENPPDPPDSYGGRNSPYDNVKPTAQSPTRRSPPRKRPSTLPLFIGNHTNIDDLLGADTTPRHSPLTSRMGNRKQRFHESSEESSECEEIDADQVIIHDSTPQLPVIRRRNRDSDRPQPDGYIPLDDTALQLYKDGDYGAYLDLEASITEQQEEFEGFQTNRKNSIVLRTQLSVRVHTIIEKLLNSEGRELRRALFSLKQIFQEDKDLVHEFVQNDGLACLIKVGNEADQNYQNYILRALGQVMLYVDGMNGVMEHGQTVQWLYTLIASRFRLVVKTALKLLLVFVEYVESNSLLLVRAVRSVDTSRGMIPWTNIMKLLKDYDAADTELLIYATTLVNKCLNGIPDQDTYYDQVDCLEEQGVEGIIQRYMSKQGTDLDLLRQFQIYEAVLHHEDGDDRGTPIRQLDDNIRKTLRNRKSLVDSHERRKSRRHSTGTSPLSMSLNTRLSPRPHHTLGLSSLNSTLNSTLPDDGDESSSSQSSQGLGDVQLNGSYKENKVDVGVTPALRRRRERAERQRSFIREQQEATANMRASIGHSDDQESSFSTNGHRYGNGSPYDGSADSPSNKLSRGNSRKDLTPLMNAANKLDSEEKKPWYGKSPDEGVECDEGNHTDEDDQDRRVVLQLKREGTVKDLTQKLAAQNLIPSSPVEDKVSRIGDMSGLISKAKEGLAKSKSKADVLKSPTGDSIPKITEIKKSENELHWEELVSKMTRPLALCDLDFTDLNSEDEVDVLSPVSVTNGVPPPPPPMAPPSMGGRAPPPPPPGVRLPPPPLFGVNLKTQRSSPNGDSAGSPKSPVLSNKKSKKTVKLFWKEVRDDPIILSRLDKNKMIWDELSPVLVDTQKLEHLFESRAKDLITKKQQEMNKNKEIIVLDHKRSNAINIGMTKLPPPRSIKTAILKMDATIMNREGIEKLLTMLPTEEERSRIQEAQAASPDLPLGSAEQFLLTLASISELPARLKLWAFKLDFENSEKEIADPLMDLKQGMETLKVNKTFRGILSTLLSIGIFLNGNEVKGFQLEYLAKVPEVKDTVHKHSLLHHLCHMVMEKFPDSTDLYSEIGAVTRASKIDFDELSGNIGKLENECKASWDHLKLIAKHDGSTMMKVKMSDFLSDCAERIIVLGIVHRRIINRFHKFILWLGIPLHRLQDTKPNEFCRIISEFALEFRTTRERVIQQLEKKANHRERNKTRGKMITEVGKFRTKEDKEDAELRQVLGCDISNVETTIHGTLPWRRQRKEGRTVLGPLLRDESTNGNLTDGDDELLESLVKTATKSPATRTTPRERKRTRHADLRRTLKNGLSEEEKKHIAAYIKGY